MKGAWQERLTTVFPRQGHYALDPAITARYPAPDFTIERIGDLGGFGLPELLERPHGPAKVKQEK